MSETESRHSSNRDKARGRHRIGGGHDRSSDIGPSCLRFAETREVILPFPGPEPAVLDLLPADVFVVVGGNFGRAQNPLHLRPPLLRKILHVGPNPVFLEFRVHGKVAYVAVKGSVDPATKYADETVTVPRG